MILKGKYWLDISNPEMNYALGVSETGVTVNYSIQLEGVTYNMSLMRFSNTGGSWEVRFYTTSDNVFPDGSLAIGAYYYMGMNAENAYESQDIRLVDFGDEPQTVTMDEGVEQMFNLVFSPLPENEFVTESNLVQVANNAMDLAVSKALDKFNNMKPTITTLLQNTSGTTSVSTTLSNYDMVFLRANAYSSYTPLCYAYPAKLLAGVSSFPIQVADNSKYSVFTATPSQISYTSGGSGKLFQVYGLKIPEVN